VTRTADIGVVGLAVMGRNLVLNMDDHGTVVAVFNRTISKVDDFIVDEASGTSITGAHSLAELVGTLRHPRKVLLMIKAGPAVDQLIESLLPLLDEGDIIIDGGNSLFTDTIRRAAHVEAAGLAFVGTGISGGEEGARTGPSIMPGGTAAAWQHIRPILQSIAASVDGTPCCDWIGSDGAGHYVKTVHNGIEYGDMQLIAEAYDIMHRGLGLSHVRMAEVFSAWNEGPLDSYLVEITADIMAKLDEDGRPVTIEARPERWGDAVILRKDVPASYHLAVVIDDARQGITHVTRGRDLFAATDLHRLLQVLLELPAPLYHHHRLLTDDEGRKLSKSAADTGLSNLRASGVPAREIRTLVGLG